MCLGWKLMVLCSDDCYRYSKSPFLSTQITISKLQTILSTLQQCRPDCLLTVQITIPPSSLPRNLVISLFGSQYVKYLIQSFSKKMSPSYSLLSYHLPFYVKESCHQNSKQIHSFKDGQSKCMVPFLLGKIKIIS